MEQKQFNLSEKIFASYQVEDMRKIIPIEDISEFIKLLIDKFRRMKIVSGDVIEFEIKQLAGEALI